MLSSQPATERRTKRTATRRPTEEGLALKELRRSRGLSMRRLGVLIGKSDSYVSHIENGRLEFPKGESLEKLLLPFDGMKPKSFYERARRRRTRLHQEELVVNWIKAASDENLSAAYELLVKF